MSFVVRIMSFVVRTQAQATAQATAHATAKAHATEA